ncbi:MAG TPA: septum formation inhibitor Maf, partial [Rhodobiaceae bacterium]|nr:septum formation inhibitor Maf [Rhodobiaceae bacterium]
MHMHKNLTLASGSQVRAELLRGAGLTFDVAVSGVDEGVIKKTHTGTPDELALKLAAAKASAVERGGLVVGADQILMCEGRLFDKPATMTAARENLKFFRGRSHALISGTVLLDNGTQTWSLTQQVHLKM